MWGLRQVRAENWVGGLCPRHKRPRAERAQKTLGFWVREGSPEGRRSAADANPRPNFRLGTTKPAPHPSLLLPQLQRSNMRLGTIVERMFGVTFYSSWKGARVDRSDSP